MKTHYDVLGVAPDSDRDVLRRAYLDLARRHHPDAGGDAVAMLAVNDAWAVLSDPRRRARYDLSLGDEPAGQAGARYPAGGPNGDEGAGVFDDLDDLDDLDDPAAVRPRASSTIDAVSLLAVLVLGAAAGGALLFGSILMIGELLGFGVFLAFLTGIATLARMLLAMRSPSRRPTAR